MSIMCYFNKIDKHFNPKLIGRIGVKDDSCNIVSQFLYDLNQMFGSWSFLHNRKIERSDNSIRMSRIALNVDIFPIETRSLKVGVVDGLGSTDIAHWDLVLFILGYILGYLIAHDDELLFVGNMWVLLKDVADCVVIQFIRILVFWESSVNWGGFYHNFKYLAVLDEYAFS